MADYPFVLNGNSYQLTSFENFAYTTGIPNSMSDLVRECLLLHKGTSTTSASIGTGSKSFTTQAGLAFRTGDIVSVADATAPQTNRMWGTILSYNFTSGSLVVSVYGLVGSGTKSNWLISVGGCSSDFGASSDIIAIDNGGTGYGNDSFTSPSAFLGLGEPSMHMEEIYEDWVGNVGRWSNVDITVHAAQPPWRSYGERAFNKWGDPNPDTDTDAGTYLLTANIASSELYGRSAFLLYGNSGFVHAGRGAMTWETVLVKPGASGYGFRCGLKAYGSGEIGSIFSYGGIGFGAEELVNNGRYYVVCGKDGNVTTSNTAFLPSSTGRDKLRFEVDHDGRAVNFFINERLVKTVTDYCPTDNKNNLLQPAYEVRCMRLDGVTVTPYLYIDSMQFRKYLLR